MKSVLRNAGLAALLTSVFAPATTYAQFDFGKIGRIVNGFSGQSDGQQRFNRQPTRNFPVQILPKEIQGVVRDVERLTAPKNSLPRPHVEPSPGEVVGEIVGQVQRLIGQPTIVPHPPICVTPPPCVLPPPTCVIPPPICVTPPCPEPIVHPITDPGYPGIPTAGPDTLPPGAETATQGLGPQRRDPNATVIRAGQTLSLPVEGLGQKPGAILFNAGGLLLKARIVEWQPGSVTFEAPQIDLAHETPATLIVQLANTEKLGEVPVVLAPSQEPNRTRVPVGSQLTLEGRNFGIVQGTVHIKVGALKMQANVVEWTGEKATCQIPALNLARPTEAELIVADGRGEIAERTEILLVAAT